MAKINSLKFHKLKLLLAVGAVTLIGCSGKSDTNENRDNTQIKSIEVPEFNADSAYSHVKKQTEFGPRVPNTEAHEKCSSWLFAKLMAYGWQVEQQEATLKAFDGTPLKSKNIYGRLNPTKNDRILLMAHYDTRPWADSDPDENKRKEPSDGANDGASGVGVLLEVARVLQNSNPDLGVDILFVDAEDWGNHDDEDSWALGANYFVNNPPKSFTPPREVVLLDMVGGKNARFAREYFSQSYAPSTVERVWNAAAAAGFSEYFPNTMGGGVTDDHLQFIRAGIPAIDIIEYNQESTTGFNPVWHTSADNMQNIDKRTLKAVGQTLLQYIYY